MKKILFILFLLPILFLHSTECRQKERINQIEKIYALVQKEHQTCISEKKSLDIWDYYRLGYINGCETALYILKSHSMMHPESLD